MPPLLTNVINSVPNRGVSHGIWPLAITFVSAGVLLSACGSSSSPSASSSTGAATAAATPGAGGVQSLTINTTDNFRFTPSSVTASPGPLRLTLTDSGSYPHNISFSSLGKTSHTVSGSPGQQSTTLMLDVKPGTYDFVCTYHSSAGMKGRLVVK